MAVPGDVMHERAWAVAMAKQIDAVFKGDHRMVVALSSLCLCCSAD